METRIIYRRATNADADLTYWIKTRSIKPYVSRVYGWNEDFQRSFHQKTFNAAHTRILSLKHPMADEPEQETVFGYIELEYRETEIFLANILIDENFQGQGLGMAVMEQLIDQAEKETLLPVRLEVFRVNKRAKAFYERLGFRVTDRDKIKYIMERAASSNSPK